MQYYSRSTSKSKQVESKTGQNIENCTEFSFFCLYLEQPNYMETCL